MDSEARRPGGLASRVTSVAGGDGPDHRRRCSPGRTGVGRSPVVARRRPAGLDRQLRRPRRSRGRARPTARAPPVVVTAECGVGGGWCWAGDDELVVVAGDGRLVAIGSPTAAPSGCSTRDGHALAPAVSARGEVACAIERDDACDIAVVPLDGSAWPVRVSHADYAWDPAWSPDGALLAWHEWDLPDMPWDASRVVIRSRRRREPTAQREAIGGDAVAASQPRFSPDGAHLAFVSDADGWPALWVADADGANARAGARRAREHAEPAWGPGQRSYAWSPDGSELAWCRNEDGFGRLVIVGAGQAVGARALEGLAPRPRLGRGRDRVRSLRRGHAAAGRRARRERLGPARGRARPGRRVRGDRARRAAAGHVEVGERDRARPAVARGRRTAGGAGRAPAARARARRPDRPGARRLDRRGCRRSCSGAGPCCSPTTAARPATARAYAQALAGHWGERDVADVAAGIRHADEGRAGPTPARVALMGGERGRASPRCSSPRSIPISCRRWSRCIPCAISSISRRRRTASSRATRSASSGRCPTRPTRTATGHRSRARPRSARRCSCCTATPTRRCRSRSRPRSPTRCARPGSPVEHHVYDGEGHGWRRVGDDRRRVRADRRVPDPVGASALSAGSGACRRRLPGPEARRRSRGAARARRGRRHARGGADHRRRRAGRRARPVAALQLPVPAARAGARPTARRCSWPRCARPRPSSPGAPSCRPNGSCSAVARWAGASRRWSRPTPTTRSRARARAARLSVAPAGQARRSCASSTSRV